MRHGKSLASFPHRGFRTAGPATTAGRGRLRRHGFSLLEMTVVIGIIMLLLTMSVIGYRYLEAKAAKDRTRTVLHDMEGMTAELDRTGGMVRLVGPGLMFTPTLPLSASSIGDVTAAGGGRGTANSYCAVALSILVQSPANQQAIAQLPPKSLVSGPGLPMTYNGVQVTPIADGWGDPILFVPPGGLSGVNLGAKADSNGNITYAQSNVTITSPDRRPFWASAGPDGNFTTGDDNVYSFEK